MTTTRIDFHSNVSEQLIYSCRLIRKALAAQCKVVVRHQDSEQQSQLDQLLWGFSDADFLPHVVVDDNGSHPLAKHTPVLLCLHDQIYPVALPHHQILLNLSTTVPANFAQFERLIEIVPQQTAATQAGRERYRFYQQQGYPLNHITAK